MAGYYGIGYVLSREDFTITKIKSQSLWIAVTFRCDVVVLDSSLHEQLVLFDKV